MYEWDEAKRESNLRKHHLDFRAAHLVYEAPEKITYRLKLEPEARFLDIALVELKGAVLALVSLFAAGTFSSSRSAMPLEGKGDVMPLPNRDLSDWKWVKEQIAADAPVPYDANDPDDGPYDPNDDAAVDRFLTEANRIHPVPMAEAKKIAKAS